MLRVPWGREVDGRRSVGTFRETWQLCWEPELEVRLIESSALGTTVETAAAAALTQQSTNAATLAELTHAVEQCLLADLGAALPGIVQLVGDRAALDLDVARLMAAVPSLARTVRYGDVRGTDAQALGDVLASMVMRVAAGLVPACLSLDDNSAAAMALHLNDMQAALSLLVGGADLVGVFHGALAEVVERDLVHASLQGRATRVLSDAGRLPAEQVSARVSRALSRGTPASDGAAFIEGFLGGSGTVLVHDADLLGMLDGWLATLDASSFVETLPLLRRTFGTFDVAERRQIGERVRSGNAPAAALGANALDPERVAAGLHTIAQLLGAGR